MKLFCDFGGLKFEAFFSCCGLWWWVDVAGGGNSGFLLVMAWVVSLCWLWYGCWLVMLRTVGLRKRERQRKSEEE